MLNEDLGFEDIARAVNSWNPKVKEPEKEPVKESCEP